jgi:hypothetical protein
MPMYADSCCTSMGCSSRPLMNTPVSIPWPPPDAFGCSRPPIRKPGGSSSAVGPPICPSAPVAGSYQ